MCSKWPIYRIKKLHFRIKQKIITVKKEQQHQKKKKKNRECSILQFLPSSQQKKRRKKDHVHIKEFRITTSKKAKAVIISNMMTTQYPHIVDGAMRNY